MSNWRKSHYSLTNGHCAEVSSDWRKSTHSGWQNCVEVAGHASQPVVAVRDTMKRDGVTLSFSASTWRNFTARVK